MEFLAGLPGVSASILVLIFLLIVFQERGAGLAPLAEVWIDRDLGWLDFNRQMFRNLSRRVEVVTPVTGRGLREKLREILEVNLRDARHAWCLDETGTYSRVASDAGNADAAEGTDELLMRRTLELDAAEMVGSIVFKT